VKLSKKDLFFLAEALRYRLEWYQRELEREDLSDDESSDLTNDEAYLQALLAHLETEYRKEG